MAGDGILVRGRNGNFQVDSSFLQPFIIERGIHSTVQSVSVTASQPDFGGWNAPVTWFSDWTTGNQYGPGDSQVYLPAGYTVDDVVIFAKPTKPVGQIHALAIDWIDSYSFRFFAPMESTVWENYDRNVDYIICSIKPEDAPRPHVGDSGLLGLQVRNDFDDIIYDSNRESFVGTQIMTGTPGVIRYGNHSSGTVYAIDGLGMLREEDPDLAVEWQTPTADPRHYEDLYVLMDPTALSSSRQAWGSTRHPRGPYAQEHYYNCFVHWDLQDRDDERKRKEDNPHNIIKFEIAEYFIGDDRVDFGGAGTPAKFQDYYPTRTLLIGKFK